MGKILQFPVKGVPVAPALPESPEDQFKFLYSTSIDHVRILTALFRKTGRLDAAGEQMMIRVVEQLKAVCQHVTGDSHGPTQDVG